MQTVPVSTTKMPKNLPARPLEEVVYQVIIVGAVLMMLGSLWIF